MAEMAKPRDTFILGRGDYRSPNRLPLTGHALWYRQSHPLQFGTHPGNVGGRPIDS